MCNWLRNYIQPCFLCLEDNIESDVIITPIHNQQVSLCRWDSFIFLHYYDKMQNLLWEKNRHHPNIGLHRHGRAKFAFGSIILVKPLFLNNITTKTYWSNNIDVDKDKKLLLCIWSDSIDIKNIFSRKNIATSISSSLTSWYIAISRLVDLV